MPIKKKYIDLELDYKKLWEQLKKENEILRRANNTFSFMTLEFRIEFEIGVNQFKPLDTVYYNTHDLLVALHELRYKDATNKYRVVSRYVTQYEEYAIEI